MQSVADPALPVSEMGELSIAIGQKLRSLAIMCLVTKGDPLLFGQNLTRSGRVRLAYLQRLRREGAEHEHDGASARIDGLMDALAASDLALASEIVTASPTTWLRDDEYEDDFCHAQLIQRLVSQEHDETATTASSSNSKRYWTGSPAHGWTSAVRC